MIGDLQAKWLITVKADTAQAKAAIKDLSAEEQKAAKARVEAQEKVNAAHERGQKMFALGAAAAVAGWSLVTSSVKKYEEHLVSLGFKGESELKRLRDMTGSLSNAQDNLSIAIGKLALEAAPAAKELANMANELARIVGGIASVIAEAKNLPGAGYVGAGLRGAVRYGVPVYGQALAVKDAYGYFAGDETVAPGRAFSRLANMGEFGMMNAEDQWRQWVRDRFTPEEQAAAKPPAGRRPPRGRGGGRRVDPYAGVFESLGINDTAGNVSGRYSQADLDLLGLGSDGGPNVEGPSPWQSVAVPQSVLDSLDALMSKLPTREESILHQLFGTPDEINAQAEAMGYATEAVNAMAGASAAAMQAWISGAGSLSEVFRKSVADGLGAIAGDLAGKATRHLIEAGAHAALFDFPGAARHAGAAALYGAGALAVGAAAKGIHPNAKTPGGGRGSYAAAGIGGGARGGGERDRGLGLTVVMGDGMSDDSPRHIARRTRRNIDLARRYADSDGAVPG